MGLLSDDPSTVGGGLLGMLSSFVDNRKRALMGLLGDPMQRVTQAKEDLRDFGREQSQWAGAERSVMPEMRDWAAQRALGQAMNVGGLLAAHTVYHGSPHKFDKFDASKIGTGEGAQAYGHGLYFAENPEVAKSYRGVGFDFGPIAPPSLAEELNLTYQDAKRHYHAGGSTYAPTAQDAIDKVKGDLDTRMKLAARNGDFETYTKTADQMAELARVKDAAKQQKGNQYKVDLPDEWLPKMLDWDKPLSEQPGIFARLKEAGIINDKSPPHQKTGKAAPSALLQMPGETQSITRALADAGIPGVKYLDQGSRGAGEGTYNYVVFPGMEKYLKILGIE